MGTIIVVMLLAVAVIGILRKMVKDKKSGKSNQCGGGCGNCGGQCHK